MYLYFNNGVIVLANINILQALLGLARQLARSKGKGMSREEINKMRAYQYKPGLDRSNHDQTTCVVCMCDFEARQKIRVLSCQHHFHSKCIDRWLKVNCCLWNFVFLTKLNSTLYK